ncbi:MAG: ATP-binding protein [Bacteroidales bacterium]|jgi:signal transduction histidine kinase|nr:ATP-binding protein [Bacteroidales bacterium]MDD2264181.1 ATP-binding protein [Bacteroidales bacterium]MDD2831348.1 ATP-binding protein [Bacteroidales bacterium]MDD3208342.1 ATP-binding protein [Bacteroidales bacterium]MDD3696975.1 ATP-binding protein [Bacteroidales bacterium]
MKIPAILREIWNRKFLIPLILSAICLVLSFFELTSHNSRMMRLVDVEKSLHRKQRKIENITLQELEQDDMADLSGKDVPTDMVIYKYYKDSLISWVNTFPIINDSYSPGAMFPDFSFFSRNTILHQPLSGVDGTEQYMNLGSAWYVVRAYSREDVTIITGILIRTDFPFSNSFVESEVNRELKLPAHCSIVPLNLDEGFIVFGKDDGVLFTILSNTSMQTYSESVILRWLAIAFGLLAMLMFYFRNRQVAYALGVIAGLCLLRFLTFIYASYLQIDTLFFSPLLFAGGPMENSLAAMILNTLCVFTGVWVIYLARSDLEVVRNNLKKCYRIFIDSAIVVFLAGILLLTHHTLKALTMDSNIVLEMFKLDEITWYTVIAYVIAALLFLSFFLLLLTLLSINRVKNSTLLSGNRMTYLFVLLSATYTMLTVSLYGREKELNLYQVWTQKMSIERDLELEMQLRRVEERLAIDPILSIMIQMEQDHDLILARIRETYFQDFLQKYQIQITICEPGDVLIVAGMPRPVSCYQFFHSEILRNGTPLAENSRFYNIDNKLGNISYIGVFTFYSYSGSQDLYIELDSRYIKDALGYPSLLSDRSQLDRFKLPYDYSYAKFIDGKLVSNSGKYMYPSRLSIQSRDGFSLHRENKSLHFYYKTENKVLIITRPQRSPLPYLVSLSYLFLFYGLIFAVVLGLLKENDLRINLPRNSFRRKITFLLVGLLVVALVLMAIGSIGFGLKLYEETNSRQMQDQMDAARSSLEEYIRFADRSNDPTANVIELMNTINRLSSNIQINVNLYDPHGRLLRSSQPDIFERHLLSARMNGEAFRQLHQNERPQYIQKERIGSLIYYSMYAPLYNTNGNLVAYINIPYLSGQTDVTRDTSAIVAAIVNLYLLLLLGAVFVSFTFSNQITRPLAELGEKISRLDVTRKPEHIHYTSDDELGVLVKAYNKMADDLDESTRRLTQSEREQAWREMARQIAHEIKNPLTPMRLSIQHLIRLKQEGSPRWLDHFDKIVASLLEQIEILSNAASEFSNFSRFNTEEPVEVELNELIKEQIVLFSTFEHIKIHFESEVNQARVNVRRTQWVSVLVNLLSNAVQSIEEQSIGVISIHLTDEGESYLISVADNGPGVAPENQHRLFKPNFTTKSSGTGLGLAICRGIVEQYRGEIFYTSSEWGGACFNVRIPQKPVI